MNLELENNVAVVTGGNRGLGRAVAFALAREGATLALVGRDRASLEATADEIAQQTNRPTAWFTCDTSKDDDVKRMVAEVLARFGDIAILVNSAALQASTQAAPKLAQIDDALFWPDVNVKVMGYLRCIREVAPHMIKRGGGRIVNISGMNARLTGSTVGSIRNVAVVALTKNLAEELAPHHISLVVVHPWVTRTEKTPAMLKARAEQAGVSEDEIERRLNAGNLTGRLITAAEVADVVAFLASPKAVGINGDSVSVGGGTPGMIFY